MAKQELTHIILETLVRKGIRGFKFSAATKNSEKFFDGVDYALLETKNLLLDYIKTSSYKYIQTRKGSKAVITNKKYKQFTVSNNHKIPYVKKTSIQQITPDTLEASINFEPIRIMFIHRTLDPIHIYFKKTSGKYCFDHVSYAGISYP